MIYVPFDEENENLKSNIIYYPGDSIRVHDLQLFSGNILNRPPEEDWLNDR